MDWHEFRKKVLGKWPFLEFRTAFDGVKICDGIFEFEFYSRELITCCKDFTPFWDALLTRYGGDKQ